ncbi:ATP-binding protein [Halorientalis litorea]|uniref:ATP-binding protein n=1 Tax=Halorientalis litorea TaxID=2931977 RepID=UPI001FF18FC7|nr:ATP-binding protein [Halorientalis litorea]
MERDEDVAPMEDFGAILDRVTDAFVGLDRNWQFTYLNERGKTAVCEAAGTEYTVEELRGQSIWDVVPEAADTDFYDEYHRAMETQSTRTFKEYYGPLSTWFEVRAYPSDTGLSVFLRDVTEQHEQRQELKHRETVLREVYGVISDQSLDFEARVEGLLAIGTRELGTEYGTLSRIRDGEYVFEVVKAPEGTVQEGERVDIEETHCERVVAEEEALVAEDIGADYPDLAENAGFTEWGIACYVGSPVIVDGEVYGTFCFYDTDSRDGSFSEWAVTLTELMGRWVGAALERRITEERLETQNERLERFATLVSHDLRNPLSVAATRLELLEEEHESEHTAAIRGAHKRMETLISDILTMARVGESVEDVTEVSLAAAAHEAWETVPTGDATLEAESRVSIEADAQRLRQLFENLFRNAVEHGGPDVTVTVGHTGDGFYVADDGPGIPESERDTVFEFGYSTAEDGTGVGLSLVAEIAAAHGWTARVTEGTDSGARFEFEAASDTAPRGVTNE